MRQDGITIHGLRFSGPGTAKQAGTPLLNRGGLETLATYKTRNRYPLPSNLRSSASVSVKSAGQGASSFIIALVRG